MKRCESLPSLLSHGACLALLALPGCSEDSAPASTNAGAGGSAVGAAGAAGGETASAGSSAAGAAGSGEMGGIGGMGGSGGGTSTPDVPRVETSSGTSVLATPQSGLNADGLCQGLAVYCNGSCLDAEGASAGNCSVLKNGLGQTRTVALGQDALYYTAASQEILRTTLSTGAHASVLAGITFPIALSELDGSLYFAARSLKGFAPYYEVKRVATTGGEVTVLSQGFIDYITAIEPAGDNLLLAIGTFESQFYALPRAGGSAERRGTAKASAFVVDGDKVYYRQDGTARVLSFDSPTTATVLNQTSTNSRLLLQDGYLYLLDHSVYMRVPVAGGAMEELQTLPSQTGDAGVTKELVLLGRTPNHALLISGDVQDDSLSHLSVLPIAGGSVTPLATLENNEYQDSIATPTHLYVAVGNTHAGAILKIALPE